MDGIWHDSAMSTARSGALEPSTSQTLAGLQRVCGYALSGLTEVMNRLPLNNNRRISRKQHSDPCVLQHSPSPELLLFYSDGMPQGASRRATASKVVTRSTRAA